MHPDADAVAAWYARAAVELAVTSELQVEWARGIAADPGIVDLIAELPREHRQPSLLFSVARWLGAPAAPWPELREWLASEWPRVAAAARERRTQTNEIGRCIPLLAALDRIPGDLALIEVGASAGLCLGVDRYAYRFEGPAGARRLGDGSPELTCRVTGGPPPERMPRIAWRRGIDLQPLDLHDPDDVSWLEALLPPDRPERLERLRDAVDRLASDPPRVVEGDALDALPGVAAEVPDGLTPVVVSLGTMVYLPPADRVRLAERCAALGARLVAFEPVTALPEVAAGIGGRTAPEPTAFLLSLDGIPLAYGSAHGERLSWLSSVGQRGDGASGA
ncbi:MAG: DUF2332 domain-containing protein [Microbacteriaceae bacterium]|nr:DUF2332 domain-containing protein [Microbacteriaceae bacterium]